MREGVGVLVGRFQTPEFHDGYHEIFCRVLQKHRKVMAIVGVTAVKNPDSHDPLSFQMVYHAISKNYPTVTIVPIYDTPSDETWSKELDSIIQRTFIADKVVLYGSRDSFMSHYKGQFPVEELNPIEDMSSTKVREKAADEIIDSSDFRKGIVYAHTNRFPVTHPTVDMALVKKVGLEGTKILLGKKGYDGELWRLPGGFVDPEKDRCLEDAAFRELKEETGYYPLLGKAGSMPIYLGSSNLDDWRYRNSLDSIMSSLFLIEYQEGSGPLKAGDDLCEIKWFDVNKELISIVADLHKPMVAKAIEYLSQNFLKIKVGSLPCAERG